MVEKIQFVLLQYAQLAIFAAGCFGLGVWPIKYSKRLAAFDNVFSACLSTTLGMGIFILALQLLGILGLLNQSCITTLLAIGYVGLLSNIVVGRRLAVAESTIAAASATSAPKSHWFFWGLLALIAIDVLFSPLHPPIDWDETMYHLPHARDWAANGKLTVNTWLRYPYFPFNFNLLYAAALSYGNDILAQMINALAGWLVAIGLYRLAATYFNRAVAGIAALLFIYLTLGQYGGATADLGQTLFLFFGFACIFVWRETKSFGMLCVALFLIGIAAGIKYQALTYLPLLAVVVLLGERRPLRLLLLLVLFALPCLYWYMRNYLLAGDPFDPMGARIFAYSDWNAADMAFQIADIKRATDWPKVVVWPALGALLLRSRLSYTPFRASLIFSIYAFVVWIFTSHYARYMMPAFPIIALLTAVVVNHVYATLTNGTNATTRITKSQFFIYTQNTLAALFLVLLSVAVIISSKKEWQTIQANDTDRSTFLKTQIKSFEISEFLRHHPEYKTVQIDLESDMYYLPANTIGDIFGPGRYNDFSRLSTMELANRIKSLQANTLLLSTQGVNSKKILERSDFLDYFAPIKKTTEAELYVLR